MWNADVLEKLRHERSISARDLARQSGIASATTIGRWLSGETEPCYSQAVALARFFDVDVRLFDDELAREVVERQPEVSDDERAILDLYHALGLSKAEALRGLALMVSRAGPPASSTGHPIDPSNGVPLDSESGRRRGTAG